MPAPVRVLVALFRWYRKFNERMFIGIKNALGRVMPYDPWVLVALIMFGWVVGLLATGHSDAALVVGLASLTLPAARFVLER